MTKINLPTQEIEYFTNLIMENEQHFIDYFLVSKVKSIIDLYFSIDSIIIENVYDNGWARSVQTAKITNVNFTKWVDIILDN